MLNVLFLTLFILDDVLEVDAKHAARKSEVTDLNSAVIIYEYISWFKVSMNNFGVMQVFKPAQDVINNRLYLVLIKEFARLQ